MLNSCHLSFLPLERVHLLLFLLSTKSSVSSPSTPGPDLTTPSLPLSLHLTLVVYWIFDSSNRGLVLKRYHNAEPTGLSPRKVMIYTFTGCITKYMCLNIYLK